MISENSAQQRKLNLSTRGNVYRNTRKPPADEISLSHSHGGLLCKIAI